MTTPSKNFRRTHRRTTLLRILTALLVWLIAVPPSAWAAPKLSWVARGRVRVSQEGDLTLIRASNGAIINYSTFLVGRNETVRFVQPHRFARVLNKVDPRMPVVINGKLEANGIVYIMNPSGIFFGDESIVNVGKLVAVAGDMSDRDFRRRIDRFTNVTGPVENKGTINAAAATLVGNTVANHGKIVSDGGLIALVAGNDVVLRRFLGRLVIHVDHAGVDPQAPAIQQTGTLDAGSGTVRLTAGDAYSLAINHTGVTRGRDIDLEGGDGAVIVAGTLDASDLRRGATGGDITVTGDRIALADATLDASGDAGGGRIRVGGDFQGKGPLPNARRTFVDDDSVLRADAARTGDGGDVIVWGDEATGFFGEVSARGGEESGDGGFAEISGKTLIAHGSVDLRAPHGETGTVLYDPLDIEIVGGGPPVNGPADGSDSDADPDTLLSDITSGRFGQTSSTPGRILAGDVGDGSDPFIIYESEIEGTNADIVLEAERGIQATGTFVASAPGGAPDVVLQSGRSLTMRTLGSEEPDVPGRARGIDLVGDNTDGEALRWVVSDGGTISLLAFSDQELDGKTAIRAGELVAGGGDIFVPVGVTVATANGGIDIALIETSGNQANPDASSVEIFAEPAIGNLAAQSEVDIGRIVARGYSVVGTDEDQRAGAGGRISITTTSANVEVGSIEASGGNAAAIAPGNGGNAANFGSTVAGISILATDGNVTIGTEDPAPGDYAILARGGTGWMSDQSGEVIQSNEGGQGAHVGISLIRTSAREEEVELLVRGDIDVTGGDGRGSAPGIDPTKPRLRTAGGRGGKIEFSSPGRTVIARLADDVPVTLSAKGGSAASSVSGEEGGSGGTGGEIHINNSVDNVGGDVFIHGRLEAGGGAAGDGLGGTAVFGNSVVIASEGYINATRAVIDTSGADGVGETFERAGQDFLDTTGGFGGRVLIESEGLVSVGTINTTGGNGENGSGANGGNVAITSNTGIVLVGEGGIDTSGGTGQGSFDGENGVIGSNGGDGGFVGVAAAAELAPGYAEVQLEGAIRSRGATGTPGDDPEATSDGVGGLVLLETPGAVEAGALGRVEAGSVTARVGSIGANGPVTIAGDGGEVSILEVEASGVVAIGLEDEIADGTDGDFAGIQITQLEAAAGTTLTRDGTAVLEVEPASGDQTVTRVDTTDMDDTVLAYRLAVPEEEGVDAPTLGLTRGNVNFGLAGGAIGNEGPLVGIGSGTAAATEGGNLKLEGTTIGTSADRIEAEGAAGASLTLIARGDAYAEVIAGSFDAVDVTQREVLGATDVILGTSDELVVSGSGTTSTVTNLQTTETGVAIAYRLDAETDPDSEEPGEATLVVENDAVNLGGDAVFASAGDVRVGTAQGIAIRTGGNGLALLADADVDGAGAVTTWNDGSGPAEIDADGGDVLLRAAEGAEVALRDGATLAAVTFSGDVAVSNASSGPGGDLVIGTVEIDDGAEADPITGAGVLSASGNARFTSDRIVLSDLETAPHVRTGGSQTFAGEVLLENARDQIIDPFEEPKTEPRHVVELEAGGDIRFEGDVVVSNKNTPDSDLEVDATLRTRAGGATYFGGDVGGAGGPGKLARLETTDAVVAGTAADTRTFTVGSAEFGGRVEGPAAMRVRASEDVHFGANVGTGSRVAGLDVEAAEIDFTGAGRVFAGDKGVLLNADDALRTEAPAVATIGTKSARLAIQTSGAFETGRYEKVSVPGELTIRASNASFGDLAATSIIVASPNIQVKGREPGPVLTGIGLFRQDRGTDIVANDITFGSVPRWDRVGTRPSFVIGNGSLNVPGVLVGFDVRRFDAASNAITPADFVGQAGEVLDLTGVGPPLTADPTREIPRTGETAFEPLAPASRSGVAPSLAPVISAPEVLAYLRCGGSAGGASTGCSSGAAASLAATPGFSKSALATERAEEMAARYRMAIGSRQAHARLRANFKVAGRVWREAVGGGAVDGAAFYRFLRESKPFAEAVAQIDELAWLLGQSELLGLSRNDTQALQESLLREFADRANMPGLDVRALEEAVRESGIGVPSQLAAAGSQSRTRLRP